MGTPPLPPDLAALIQPPPRPLQSISLRVDPLTAGRIDALRDRLNGPNRGALLGS